MSAIEEWVKGHEALCTERFGDIKSDVADLKITGTWIVRGVFGMLAAVCAWLAIQLWNGQQADMAVDAARIAALERPAGAATVVVQPQAVPPK